MPRVVAQVAMSQIDEQAVALMDQIVVDQPESLGIGHRVGNCLASVLFGQTVFLESPGARAARRAVGRPHLRRALSRRGYVD